MINDEFVALCPTFLMDDRDEAFRKGCRGAALLRRGDLALGRAQRRRAGARHRAASTTSRTWHEHLAEARAAIARGDAPPTAASSLYNTDHALGDADTAIAYVRAARATRASTT